MDIDIQVETEFLPQHSDLIRDYYAFAYHIRITNNDGEPVTLRNRYWEITDALGKHESAGGVGVVGEQPTLQPSGTFRYTSGVRLNAPWGKMSGKYEFETFKGERFWAEIPPFELRTPRVLQ
ncbi:Co2+/Mg2+ efflux protein ApaG [Stenoxybacter acetivorans]|uniref:Co2+/Mg2+ efflux protein ApaG n=1 Tax=Stenoxybacter acetivorans TaxID=422441 RepID=UPI0005699D3F|nr:Co2+/Mg2+ efflux protein ApaG [Stenoxybacter acetivorans]